MRTPCRLGAVDGSPGHANTCRQQLTAESHLSDLPTLRQLERNSTFHAHWNVGVDEAFDLIGQYNVTRQYCVWSTWSYSLVLLVRRKCMLRTCHQLREDSTRRLPLTAVNYGATCPEVTISRLVTSKPDDR
jgi:hypothetical protein